MELFASPQNQQKNQQQGQQQPQQSASQTMGGLLGQDKKQPADANKIEEISSEVKTLTNRIRSLEEKSKNLRTAIQMNEKNLLEDSKKKNTEMADVNQQIFELKKNSKEIKDKMDIIIKELALSAKKEDVTSIEKYLNLWNPVSFVSQKEILPVVRRALLQLGIKSKDDITNVDEVKPELEKAQNQREEEEPLF